jgi:Xaa-Pro aminopeptidase
MATKEEIEKLRKAAEDAEKVYYAALVAYFAALNEEVD